MEWQPIETAPHNDNLIGWGDGWQEPEIIWRDDPAGFGDIAAMATILISVPNPPTGCRFPPRRAIKTKHTRTPK